MRAGVCVVLLSLITGQVAAEGLDGIKWWKGDVQAAFDKAAAEERPLFLYWGAVWCPPCNQVKKTIFTRREFQEKMSLFLPVYLDGDTESAQIWGEKLGAAGYPTMIVFNPEGEEVTRIPGGIQLDQYLEILDRALGSMTPIGELLEQALAAPSGDAVPDASYRLLAYYSWGQDRRLELEPAELEESFRKLVERVPERLRVERARLHALWLDSVVQLRREQEEDKLELSAEQRAAADRRVRELLDDRELALANLDFVLYSAGDVVLLLHPEPSPERTRLLRAWEKRVRWVEANDDLSVDERVSALLPLLEFHTIERGDKPLPQSFVDNVKRRAAWADEASKDQYTRQASISTAGWLLRQVGADEQARELYLAQLDKAVSPHYFMSSLSSLAHKQGKTQEAIDWLRKAWESAEGHATRFQWGTGYLLGLMELAPDDDELVRDESIRVFEELLAQTDAFAGRNAARIKRLQLSYAAWNAEDAHAKALAAVSKRFAPACGKLSEAPAGMAGGSGEEPQSQRQRCSDFFAQLGKPQESEEG